MTLTHEELVEAVARAMNDKAQDIEWHLMSRQEGFSHLARAAFAAVREMAGLTGLQLGWAGYTFLAKSVHGSHHRAAALLRALAPGEGE